MRYDINASTDGLPPGEGVFLAYSFWLADNYILQRCRGEASAICRRLLTLRNGVGLPAEEFDPRTIRVPGNFPSTFRNVGVINTALRKVV